MKTYILALLLFLSSGSAWAIDMCAGDIDGYFQNVEICSYNTVITNERTQCTYSGKLWGDLGGIIFNEVATHLGHSSCDATINIDAGTLCDYIDPTPNTPNPPGTIEDPVFVCDVYNGDIRLFRQEYLSDTVQEVIPGSCHTEREWVNCY